MRADIANLLADDGSLDLAGAIENGFTHIIKKLTIRKRPIKGTTGEHGEPKEETTYEIVLHDSQSAAWRLARILHLEVKNRPPEARRPTDDELAHRMADLLERARANGRREGAIQRPPDRGTGSDSDRPAYSTGSDSDRSDADPEEASHSQPEADQHPHQTPDSRLETRDSRPTSQPPQRRKWLLNWADPKLHTTAKLPDGVVESMSPEERVAYLAFWRRMEEESRKENLERRS